MNRIAADLPLAGLTVVDLTRVLAGPYCTMMLADLGARVIKIENPEGGDDSRHVGPFVDGESAYFASVNRNKESIALDLKSPRDREVLAAMIAGADVLVENFRAGVMEKLGFTWEALHAANPRLVYASISGFGQTGPYRDRPAYDMVVQAMGGLMSVTGQTGGAPVRVGVSIGDLGAGLYAAIGIQSALLKRSRTGLGERVDIGMLDCQVALLENAIARHSATGAVPAPLGTRHPSITPFDMFKTADGFIVIAAGNDTLFQKLCAALGQPDLAADPRFATVVARNQHHAELKASLEARLADADSAAWSTRWSVRACRTARCKAWPISSRTRTCKRAACCCKPASARAARSPWPAIRSRSATRQARADSSAPQGWTSIARGCWRSSASTPVLANVD